MNRSIGDGSYVQNRVVSTQFCRLVAVIGYNGAAADRFIQIFEAGAVPEDGAVPKFHTPASAKLPYSFVLPEPIDLEACTVCVSSTADTLTAVDEDFSIQAIVR